MWQRLGAPRFSGNRTRARPDVNATSIAAWPTVKRFSTPRTAPAPPARFTSGQASRTGAPLRSPPSPPTGNPARLHALNSTHTMLVSHEIIVIVAPSSPATAAVTVKIVRLDVLPGSDVELALGCACKKTTSKCKRALGRSEVLRLLRGN
mmetsp:Transcript_63336/g.188600  ORF Transcript_63336/g.188600 Transcript_63336/m.188600 type:complete len:150 (-) Transcript_63336:67-516(-)